MKKLKAQSLIEYVLTLTMIIMLIVGGTIGFHRGVQNSVNTFQRSVDAGVSNPSPWRPNSYYIKNPEEVGGSNPTAGYNDYLNHKDNDTGGKPSNPNI